MHVFVKQSLTQVPHLCLGTWLLYACEKMRYWLDSMYWPPLTCSANWFIKIVLHALWLMCVISLITSSSKETSKLMWANGKYFKNYHGNDLDMFCLCCIFYRQFSCCLAICKSYMGPKYVAIFFFALLCTQLCLCVSYYLMHTADAFDNFSDSFWTGLRRILICWACLKV